MYRIELTCWYQSSTSIKGITQNEYYHNLEFESMEEACVYLGKNVETILNEYPVESIKVVFEKKKNGA